jgi:CO/xanthine dehydrogenase FAD-binding subunit
LKEYGSRAKIIAGGTGLYEIAHRGLLSDIEALIDINGLGLSFIKLEDDYLCLGAATTMSSLSHSKLVSSKPFGAIGDALSAIQPLQVKNVATIGGAICTALPFFDLPVALMALDARVVIGPGSVTKKLSDFIQGYFAIDLSEGEFLKEVRVPNKMQESEFSSAFQKFALTHDDWAMVNCAAAISLDGSTIKNMRLFFGGGVGDKVARAKKTEESLLGVRAEENEIKEIISKNLPSDIEPISDIRASAGYRMHIAKVLGLRTVMQAFERGKNN